MKNRTSAFEEKRVRVQKVKFKTVMLVFLLALLTMSSGLLYYRDSPMFFYGSLGVGIGMIFLIVYMVIFVTEQRGDIFSESDSSESDDEAKHGEDTGLEHVLKAEQKFKKKHRKSRKSMRKSPKEKDETVVKKGSVKTLEKKRKKIDSGRKTEKKSRKNRIGSIPIEESVFAEKMVVNKGSKKSTKAVKEEVVTTFLCPDCGSRELYYESGLISGYKYHCKDCDYIGSFVIEKDFKVNANNS